MQRTLERRCAIITAKVRKGKFISIFDFCGRLI